MTFKTLCLSFLISSLSFAICDRLELDGGLAQTGFKLSRNSALSWFSPHHSASDVITVPTHEAVLNAKFAYGPMHKDLVGEEVELWIDTCGDSLHLLGIFNTDSDGRVKTALSADKLPPVGAYQLWMRVAGDSSFTQFTLRVLKPGAKLAIFDIDGTLTYSDTDSTVRPGGIEITHQLKDMGREIVYLSGRHYILAQWTRDLLDKNHFSNGSLILAQSLLDIVPVESSVGEFKAETLRNLKDLGLVLERAYGNSPTDRYAYEEAQIPDTHIFILGKHGSLGEDFLTHLSTLALFINR